MVFWAPRAAPWECSPLRRAASNELAVDATHDRADRGSRAVMAITIAS